MYPRKRLDMGWSDLVAGLGGCLNPRDREAAQSSLEALWSPKGDAFACLSIRTGFDLMLKTLDLPRGSEILVSAITIPHMIHIMEHHGLVPVPIDLDMDRLQVRADLLEAAITPKTRAILCAHIFGARMDLEPVADIADRHGLMLFEDAAQGFYGDDYRGNPRATVSMFSFGSIKTAAALGGSLFTVRDADLLRRMRLAYDRYPVRSRAFFAKRLMKYCLLFGITDTPSRYGATMRLIEASGRDPDKVIMAASRGFSGPDFFNLIRQRPSAPLMALVERRLRNYDPIRVARRRKVGLTLARHLPKDVWYPGRQAKGHTFWLFPILAERPGALRHVLSQSGFDATLASTSLAAVPAPEGWAFAHPKEAHCVMRDVLYLPLDADMPESALAEMAAIIAGSMPEHQGETHADTGAGPKPSPNRQAPRPQGFQNNLGRSDLEPRP